MKALRKLIFISFLFTTVSGAWISRINAQNVSVSFSVFYNELSPYGSWVDYPSYGYVWVPSVGAGFYPYGSGGYWSYTSWGWTWVSDYSWGWAPFHYGRWNYDPYYGWIWIPGNTWGPAWVIWRDSPGYYGWAPMPYGSSINFTTVYYDQPDRWIFVSGNDFCRHDIHNYYSHRVDGTAMVKSSYVISHTQTGHGGGETYFRGPGRDEVKTKTGREVAQMNVGDKSSPGQTVNKSEVQFYRPKVQHNSSDKPTKFTPRDQVNSKEQPGQSQQRQQQQQQVKPQNQQQQQQVKPQQQQQQQVKPQQQQQQQVKPQQQQQQQVKPQNQQQQVKPQQQHQQQVKPQQQHQQQVKPQQHQQQMPPHRQQQGPPQRNPHR